MNKLFKHPLYFLVFIYFLSRIFNLLILPVFNDEAIYLDWGYRQINSQGHLFYSLYDAKPPFLIWIFGLSRKVISDPLLAGRIVSVFAGFLTLTGLYKLSVKYFDKKTAMIAALIYISTPLFVLYDRQALMESALAAIGVWSVYILLKFIETKNPNHAILLGMVLATGIFIKLSAVLFVAAVAIIIVLDSIKAKKINPNILFAPLVMFLILLPLISQELFWKNFHLNSRFSLGISEIIKLPFDIWLKNLLSAISTLSVYFFIPVTVAFFAGIYTAREKTHRLISLYVVTLLFVAVLVSRNLTVRYITAFLPLITVFAASAVSKIRLNKTALLILVAITLAIPACLSFYQITNPPGYFATLKKYSDYSMEEEYVSGWTSGYGVRDAINYINQQTGNGYSMAAIRVDAGNPESSVMAYFQNTKNIMPFYFDSKFVKPETLVFDCIKSQYPVYYVSRDGNLAGMEKFFKEEIKFSKPKGPNYVGVHMGIGECGNALPLN